MNLKILEITYWQELGQQDLTHSSKTLNGSITKRGSDSETFEIIYWQKKVCKSWFSFIYLFLV